jgi:hypothetical protein
MYIQTSAHVGTSAHVYSNFCPCSAFGGGLQKLSGTEAQNAQNASSAMIIRFLFFSVVGSLRV